jgi:hypothetical protein
MIPSGTAYARSRASGPCSAGSTWRADRRSLSFFFIFSLRFADKSAAYGGTMGLSLRGFGFGIVDGGGAVRFREGL